MMRKTILALLLLAVASSWWLGCGQEWDGEYETSRSANAFTVVSTIPSNGFIDAVRCGKILIRFNRELDAATVKGSVKVHGSLPDGSEWDVPVQIGAVGPTLYVNPKNLLAPAADYRVTVFPTVRAADGGTPVVDDPGYTFTFSTRPLRAVSTRQPEVIQVHPSPDDQYVFDSSTFRILFSEPIDESEVVYGESVRLVKVDGEELVTAMAFARGSQIVVDPAADLDPAFTYRLDLSTSIRDRNGDRLPQPISWEYTITNTYPHSQLIVEDCPTLGTYASCAPLTDPAALPTSTFTGNPVNTLVVESTLLGRTTIYVSAIMASEIGDPGLDPNFVPVIMRKGQRIVGESIDADLGGEVSTGYQSGPIPVTLITDGVGVLSGSSYANGVPNEESSVHLFLDVAFNTSANDPAFNSMMGQPVLGVELAGTSYVEDDKMIMDLAGFAEIELQGEKALVTFSLNMVSATVPDEMLQRDNRPPILESYTPYGDDRRKTHLNELIVGNFDEPLSPNSVQENFYVQTRAGAKISGRTRTIGSRIVFESNAPMLPHTEYQIVFGRGIADVSGNARTESQVINFFTGPVESGETEDNPPILTTTLPGEDPTAPFPAHLPLIISFNQLIDPDSVTYGGSFSVWDLTENILVRGTVYHRGGYFTFEPDQLWSPGHTYRMILTDEITNQYGFELDLDMDRVPGGNPGFEEFSADFTAVPEDGTVLLLLKLDPVADSNGSGFIDGSELIVDSNTIDMSFLLFKDPGYVSGYMIGLAHQMERNENNVPYIPVDVGDGTFMSATSVGFSAFASALMEDPESFLQKGLFDPMGRITIDITTTGTADITQTAAGTAQMKSDLEAELLVENQTYQDLLEKDVSFSPGGGIFFTPDGRMQANLRGRTWLKGSLTIPILGWTIPLRIPADMDLRVVGEPFVGP
jgi:Bacterial Ig-like domain